MANHIKRSFNLILIIMRFVGLYPPQKYQHLDKIRAFCLYFLFIIVVSMLVMVKQICQEGEDVTQKNLMVAYLSEVACLPAKLLPFISKSQRVKKCINYFSDPRFAPKGIKEEAILIDCVKVCRRNSTVFVTGLSVALSLWIVSPLMIHKDYKLPLDIWLPYNPASDVKKYCLTFVFLTVACLYTAYSGPIVDPLIGGLIYFATGQLKILKYNLEHLHEKGNNSKNVYEKLKKCIQHYDAIFDFMDEFEECFSWALFSQFASCVVTVGFICMDFLKAPLLSVVAARSVLLIGVVLFRMFFYCYYGTLLHEENNGLRDAICAGSWYDYDAKSKNSMIILMERSKRPLTIITGKLLELTLSTFIRLLRSIYSLLAVLQNFQ